MDKELEQKIFDSYPILFRDRINNQYAIRHGIECSNGWFDIINGLCQKIESLVRALPEEKHNEFRVLQIKEKFGGLRFYMSSQTDEMTEEIGIAESKVWTTCERCGANATTKSRFGWIRTLCDGHHDAIMAERQVRDAKYLLNRLIKMNAAKAEDARGLVENIIELTNETQRTLEEWKHEEDRISKENDHGNV